MIVYSLLLGLVLPAGMPMFPPMMPPPVPDCEGLDSPLICSLAKTRGQCTWITRDNKCDIAEKCGGRSQQDCALYWTGNYQGPNCVWLALEEKCDSSDKCYGRDKATCMNTAFPRCTWVAPYTNSWGQVYPGGACSEFKGLSIAYQQIGNMSLLQQQVPGEAASQPAAPMPSPNLIPGAIPVQMECEALQSPLVCNLQSTLGNCAWLESDQKCDIAEKCGGRSKATCALYFSLKYNGPNCVWLEMENKCDSSSKCYGRDKATCMNKHFPRCTWTQPYLTTWGQEYPEGMCTELKGVAFLPGMKLETAHNEEPSSESSSSTLPLNAIFIGIGSFFGSAVCTFFILQKRKKMSELTSPL